MHLPPPVRVAVRRSRWLALLLWMCWMVGFLLAVAWLFPEGRPAGWRAVATGLSSIAVACWLFWLWFTQQAGQLEWDGKDWAWLPSGHADAEANRGSASVMLDLHQALLLRYCPVPGRPMWLWIDRGMCGNRWRAVRRAVAGDVRPDAAPGQAGGTESR